MEPGNYKASDYRPAFMELELQSRDYRAVIYGTRNTKAAINRASFMEPGITKPAIIGPAFMEPGITKPAITGPSIYRTRNYKASDYIGPASIEPGLQSRIIGPAFMEPGITKPAITGPAFMEPGITKPRDSVALSVGADLRSK
nr:uncharacterized protein LOC113811972 [Penaeus vannamei]